MSFAAAQNTLAYQYRGRPLNQILPVAKQPMSDFVNQCEAWADGKSSVQPEQEGLWFYLMEHAMHAMGRCYHPEQPLEGTALAVATEYNRRQAQIVLRSLYYLLLITTREARHAYEKDAMHQLAKDKYGFATKNALYKFPDSAHVGQVCSAIRGNCPKAPAAEYFRWLTEVFVQGKFSGGFGGKPWSDIARCIAEFCEGKTTLAMMTDISWSLAHNNGPIFNKGMLYNHYDKKVLTELLDVQRAGMIPAYIRHCKTAGYANAYWVTKEMHVFCNLVWEATGDADFDPEIGQIDWQAVMDLGALQTYSYGPVTPQPATPKPQAPHKTVGETLMIMPGMHVELTKIDRVKQKLEQK